MRRVSDTEPWSDDETLLDEVLDLPADDEHRHELLDQRFVHGLLRAQHTADAAHREARVEAVMAAIDGGMPRSRFWLAAAIALVSFCAAIWFSWPDAPPRADAMVQRALDELSEPANRRYSIEVTLRRAGRRAIHREYTLTVRGPRQFLLEGPSLLGPTEVGCDGEVVWGKPSLRWLRWSRPWQPGGELGSFLSQGRLDTDDLDLATLLTKLRKRARSLSVERVGEVAAGGDPTVRIEARNITLKRGRRFVSVILELGEQSGELRRVEVVRARGVRWQKRVVFEYEGTTELPEDAFRRPW